MRLSWPLGMLLLFCSTSPGLAQGAEPVLGLKGQLYFEEDPATAATQPVVPRHIPQKHVARTPIDFSYPATAASIAPSEAHQDAVHPHSEELWDLDFSDGAKLRFDYDKDTKLSLGMGMWKVKLGVSKKFGRPSAAQPDWPERNGSAAGMGRADTSTRTSSLD